MSAHAKVIVWDWVWAPWMKAVVSMIVFLYTDTVVQLNGGSQLCWTESDFAASDPPDQTCTTITVSALKSE